MIWSRGWRLEGAYSRRIERQLHQSESLDLLPWSHKASVRRAVCLRPKTVAWKSPCGALIDPWECLFKKINVNLFVKDREATGWPPQGIFKVAVHPPRKEDSAWNISVIVKLVTTGRTANSFVTTNKRSLFGHMRPVYGTLDACDQSAVRRSLSSMWPGKALVTYDKDLYIYIYI